MSVNEGDDRWAQWILSRRFGGDRRVAEEMYHELSGVRDKVVANAGLRAGSVLLDVGAGDGLVGFAGLRAVEPNGRVIFTDISELLLDRCRAISQELGVADRVHVERATAETLEPIGDGSVDAVTTRSVLIYVKDKAAAFRQFFRVLRAGGRISLAEPINRDMTYRQPEPPELQKLRSEVHSRLTIGDPDADPMTDFTERDLLRFCRDAGFLEIHIELCIDQKRRSAWPWDAYLSSSPNPNAPTVREALEQLFDATQFATYQAFMRPIVENGELVDCSAMCYLWAVKP